MAKKIILITGSTGKQGRALISALLPQPTTTPTTTLNQQSEFHILALTRSLTSLSSQKLRAQHNITDLTLVEGDLDNESSVRVIFENEEIWGVFAVLAYPGLGVDASREEEQGKMLANLALEHNVKAYLYSSAMRAGPKYENEMKLSRKAKVAAENHCIELGKKGLPWTILRPGFFMENFEDYLGSIAAGVMTQGLKSDTTLNLISSDDIGNVAAGVFKNHEKYTHKILTVVAEFLTTAQLNTSHLAAAGKPLPMINFVFAWLIIKLNGAVKNPIQEVERNLHARDAGEYPEHVAEIALANEAFKMRTYEEWKRKDVVVSEYEGGWNGVSLGKLLTGRM